MKKTLAVVLTMVVALSTAACGASGSGKSAKSEGVMTYAEYAAAELDSEVVVETYVQAKQSWWENKATIYTQDADGGYFIYELPCTEDEYNKLVPGTKIKVTGYKSEWSGEVEIVDATYEIESGDTYVAKAQDVTGLLGKDELVERLIDAINNGNQAPALKYVDDLAAKVGETDVIGEIRRCIKNIDFDKAEEFALKLKR